LENDEFTFQIMKDHLAVIETKMKSKFEQLKNHIDEFESKLNQKVEEV